MFVSSSGLIPTQVSFLCISLLHNSAPSVTGETHVRTHTHTVKESVYVVNVHGMEEVMGKMEESFY